MKKLLTILFVLGLTFGLRAQDVTISTSGCVLTITKSGSTAATFALDNVLASKKGKDLYITTETGALPYRVQENRISNFVADQADSSIALIATAINACEQVLDEIDITSIDSTGSITETAAINVYSFTSVTGGGQTIAIPQTPSTGWQLIVKDYTADFGTDNLTLDPTGGTQIDAANTYVLDAIKESVVLLFNGTRYLVVSAYKE